MKTHKKILNNSLDVVVFGKLTEYTEMRMKHESELCRSRLKRKVDMMIKKEPRGLNEQCVVNLSSKQISPSTTSVISKGLSKLQ